MDVSDPLLYRSPPDTLWSRANTAEAIPVVLRPMTWSFYGELTEVNVRRGFADLGVIPRSATRYPDEIRDRFMGIFHGRTAINVGELRALMRGLPGVSGDDVERDVLGSVRAGVIDKDYGRRTAAVLAKAPVRLAFNGRRSALFRAEMGAWWSSVVDRGGPRIDARRLLAESIERFGAAIRFQGRTRIVYQGACSQLASLAEQAGDPTMAVPLLSGTGRTEETEVADDLWSLAHGRSTLDSFLARHGYLGPSIGDIATRSWREEPRPIERLLPAVRESEEPAARRGRLRAQREQTARRLLTALPAHRRPAARIALRMAPATAQTLERTKMSFLVALDAARAAVRALGAEMVTAGRMADPDDAFYLLVEELLDPPIDDLHDFVAVRRAQWETHGALKLPNSWIGQPQPVLATEDATDVRAVTGLGVSPGVVEGRVRVVLDPAADSDIEYGDVLVCPTTDPGWVSVMTVASALVIDLGGLASHGAIVARELGVPCVIGTSTGTVDLRDGDLVRVDGSAGTVEVLERS